MATVGNLALTLSDYRKRMTPDGALDQIIEYLAQANPVLEDMKVMQGNLPTGNIVTQRTSYPKPSIRTINQGIAPTKSTTKQVTDTCAMLEARSEVDIKLLGLQPDKKAFRLSEDKAHMQGFADAVADMLFNGNTETNPDEFNGLKLRYKELNSSAEKGDFAYQVISAGTPNADALNSSIWIVGWGEQATAGIYPKNGVVGLQTRDLGEYDAFDKDNKRFRAVGTLFNWDIGLMVRNPRQNARICNIDSTKLRSMTSAQKLAVVESIIYAKNRIAFLNKMETKHVLYCDTAVYTMLETYLVDKTNVHVTRQELMGQMPKLYIAGLPVEKLDCLAANEAALTE